MDLSKLSPEQRAQVEEKLKSMSPEEIAALQSQQSIFRQIVAGKIPSKKIFDDEKSIAILDIKPASKGHMLLLTKQYYAIMPQIPDDELGELLINSKKLSLAALKGARATGSTFYVANGAAAGQKVQDFMIHIIPRRENDGLFDYDKKLIDLDKRRALRNLIAAKISQLTGMQDPAPEQEESKEIAPTQENDNPNVQKEQKSQNQEISKEQEFEQKDDDHNNQVEEKQETNNSSRDVDLDDIANLFS